MQPETTKETDKKSPRRIEFFNEIASIINKYICSSYKAFSSQDGGDRSVCGKSNSWHRHGFLKIVLSSCSSQLLPRSRKLVPASWCELHLPICSISHRSLGAGALQAGEGGPGDLMADSLPALVRGRRE